MYRAPKRAEVKCDICGEWCSLSLESNTAVPVHTTREGHQFVHPYHAIFGYKKGPQDFEPTLEPPNLQAAFDAGYIPESIWVEGE